ncbi:MAG: site-2 protease family protein [Nanoarchaeota archaeon]|nr:site-2 protease family protein [Nanoarchaeota archaeon]
MDFMFYDLFFLVIFVIISALFIFFNKKNLKREGIIYLYRTQIGTKIINYIGGKYKRTLNVLKYFSILIGYVLMVGIIFLFGRSVYIYARYPQITDMIKAPPIAPVIPYFPKLFHMESFFPPFYFTYFILALAIVAIVHEFAHGIFMKHNKIKIKSTGIAFLGPILGAFVEQDETSMKKIKKTDQMAILSAGVFANIIFAGIFLLIWAGIFYLTFTPSGVLFDTYLISAVNVSDINFVNGISIENPANQKLVGMINRDEISDKSTLGGGDNFTEIIASGEKYYIKSIDLKKQLETNNNFAVLYPDLPAINIGLKGIIIEVNGNKIETHKQLMEVMQDKKPQETINLKTNYNGEINEYDFALGQYQDYSERGTIGIINFEVSKRIEDQFAFFKNKFTDYKIKNEFMLFLYYLIFWIFFFNLLVAFFNMLPFAILDGGRFFYLVLLGITNNEKISKRIYKFMGLGILFFLTLLMAIWFFRII